LQKGKVTLKRNNENEDNKIDLIVSRLSNAKEFPSVFLILFLFPIELLGHELSVLLEALSYAEVKALRSKFLLNRNNVYFSTSELFYELL
jgi:hypothetical protein